MSIIIISILRWVVVQSYDIVRSYQQQYTNLRLIQQDNAGLGAARNTGIAHAQSNYIYFCDGDDRVVPNMIQRCLTLCYASSLDLLLFGASQFTDEQYSGMRTPGILCRNTWSHLTGDQYTQLLLQGKEPFQPEVWCYVVRTAILQQHHIRFVEGVYFEDELFTPLVIAYSKNIQSMGELLYQYRLRNNSIMANDHMATHIKRLDSAYHVLKSLAHQPTPRSPQQANAYSLARYRATAFHYSFRKSYSQLSLIHKIQYSRKFLMGAYYLIRTGSISKNKIKAHVHKTKMLISHHIMSAK